MYANSTEKLNAITNLYFHFNCDLRMTTDEEEIAIINKILDSLEDAVKHCGDLGSLQLEKKLEKED